MKCLICGREINPKDGHYKYTGKTYCADCGYPDREAINQILKVNKNENTIKQSA